MSKLEFQPSKYKVLGVSSQQALGRAMEIMLKAIGFGTVEIILPKDVCKQATEMNPDFILFTPEYLKSTIQEKIEAGCPCNARSFCKKAQVVMLLKTPNGNSVLSSTEMGFDTIVFANSSINKMYETLERAYLHHHRV
jgi:PleD family two-component response regulator